MRTPAVIQRSFTLPFSGPPVMATGSQQQNTLSITSGDQASLSRTLGNLDSPSVCIDHEVVASEMIIWQGKIPAVVACDRDPDFYSTRFAIEMASRLGVPNQMVQHHHAHVAAVCVENLLVDPVIGVVLDDRGLGTDGHIWGGELLLVEGKGFTRLGHLAPIAMPGGGIVLREPWRMGAAALHGLKRGGEIRYRYQHHPASLDVAAMLDEERNCPLTSCAAMMIMAAADLLQLDFGMQEADANNALEAAAVRYFNGDYGPVPSERWSIDENGLLDLHPLFAELAEEGNSERGAATFHSSLIAGVTEWVAQACDRHGINRVVLAGSCFMNRLLAIGLRDNLRHRGRSVYEPMKVLPDDSALALGQAWVALQTLRAA